MLKLLSELLNNQRRIHAMNEAYRRLTFCSFEARNLGVVRVVVVIFSAWLLTTVSFKTNSPIPLFLLLTITAYSFVGSLFPRQSFTPKLANAALAFPLLTYSALFFFGADFLLNTLHERLHQTVLPLVGFVIALVIAVQFSYTTLRIHLPDQGKLGKFRWVYAVASLDLIILYIVGSYVNHEYPNLFAEVIQSPTADHRKVSSVIGSWLEFVENFLRLDTILLVGICLVIVIEGFARALTFTIALPAKSVYEPIEYPLSDVGGSFWKSFPRDAQIAFRNLCGWLLVQARKIKYFGIWVKCLLFNLVKGLWQSFLDYATTGISAGLLLVGELLAMLFVAMAIWLLYFAATNILKGEGETVVFLFYFEVLGAAWILLIAYIANYFRYARDIARHFRHSFLGFAQFFSLVGMLTGAVLWWQVGERFRPGITAFFVVIASGVLGYSVRKRGREDTSSQGKNGTNGAAGPSITKRLDDTQCWPSIWIYFLMFAISMAIAWRQGYMQTGIDLINRVGLRVEELRDVEIGKWTQHLFHGEANQTKDGNHRSYTFPDGGKSVGEFKDGKPDGQGTLTFPDGGKIVGEFKDGKPHGQGILTFLDGGKYVGGLKDGKPHGQGTRTFPDGRKYVGEFKDGKLNGQGTRTLSNGQKYVGEWRDGERNGQGTEYRTNGTILQSGIWENGRLVRGR